KAARRETDTFDTFFESSWYFARYTAPHAQDAFEKDALKYWMPVDCYIGGIEHAVLHLLYSRFFCRALSQCGFMDTKEPFRRLETQGMICHETYKSSEGKWLSPDDIVKGEDGRFVEATTRKPVTVGRIEKMSKSKRNTVDPRHIMESYGADSARLFMLSDSPPDRDLEWTDAGIEGAWRYINRLWRLVLAHKGLFARSFDVDAMMAAIMKSEQKNNPAKELVRMTHKTVKSVTEDIDRFHFNKAIARLRELTNLIEQTKPHSSEDEFAVQMSLKAVIPLLGPFMPHLAEEMWQQLGNATILSAQPWPSYDPVWVVDDEVTIAIQVNGKLRTTLQLPKDMDKDILQAQVMELEQIRSALQDKSVRKVIVVPNRIVNVVAS
ncbi:MAG: class I tRNA ligase family protein, partial [Alphaproteobacteria bacterium]